MHNSESPVLLTEQQASELFVKIKPILKEYRLLHNEEDWVNLYDLEDEESIIGYVIDLDENTELQLEFYEISNGYAFHYWNNDTHVCEFTTTVDGTIVMMIRG